MTQYRRMVNHKALTVILIFWGLWHAQGAEPLASSSVAKPRFYTPLGALVSVDTLNTKEVKATSMSSGSIINGKFEPTFTYSYLTTKESEIFVTFKFHTDKKIDATFEYKKCRVSAAGQYFEPLATTSDLNTEDFFVVGPGVSTQLNGIEKPLSTYILFNLPSNALQCTFIYGETERKIDLPKAK